MKDLLDMEPREAGPTIVEPAMPFDVASTLEDRTMCTGCCVEHSAVVYATHSATQ